VVVLTGLTVWAVLVLAALPPVSGQQPGGPNSGDEATKDQTALSQSLFLPDNPDVRKKLATAAEYVKESAWAEATRTLQAFLDADEDILLPLKHKGADGEEELRWSSVRAEASRLIAALPPKGLDAYEDTYGPRGRLLLLEARKQRDPEMLAEVGRRYLHTAAGVEALNLLATYHLDRGSFGLAARCFDQVLQSARADRLPPLALYKAALASHHADDPAGFDYAWKLLSQRAADGVRLGDRTVALTDLRKELDRWQPEAGVAEPPQEWRLYGGNARRSAPGAAGTPVLEPRWQEPVTRDPAVLGWLEEAAQKLETRSQPVIPAAFGLVVGDKAVYPDAEGLRAVDLQTGKLAWRVRSGRSLLALAGGNPPGDDPIGLGAPDLAHGNHWVAAYLQSHPHIFFANSVIGMLSADSARVYAVEDLPLPPYPNNYQGFVGKGGRALQLSYNPELGRSALHSRLLATDLHTGKVVWDVGGPEKEGGPLGDSFFLGPPLPYRGKLYVLVEKNQELRLVCMEPARGEVVWSQLLAITRNRMVLDGGRRLHAAPLACAEGILVCPTNAGAVLGFDLLAHRVLWTYVYREEPPAPKIEPQPWRGRRRIIGPTTPPNLDPLWQVTAPVIHEGKVLFTAPDEASVYCLDLRDGGLRWKTKRQANDLYLAGVADGKVLLAGKEEFRALGLNTGAQLWQVQTGVPSGQGVLAGKTYYLPVKADAEKKEPGILALALDEGKVATRHSTEKKELPGNLIFCRDTVLSQTATTVTAYPLR
jgi:outer membrane protein assembly factor BamB